MISTPVYTQPGDQLFNIDGNESGATAYSSENNSVNPTITTDLSLSYRVAVECAVASGGSSDVWQLQVSKNGGSYTDVTTSSSGIKAYDSSYLTNGGSTTAQLGTPDTILYTFAAGKISETGSTTYQILANAYTEFLFPFTVVYADVSNGDTFDFRVVVNSTVLNSYNHTLRITVTKAGTNSSWWAWERYGQMEANYV